MGLVTPLFLSLVPAIFVRPFFFPLTAGLFFPAGFFPVFLPAPTPIADALPPGFAQPLVFESDEPTVAPPGQISGEDEAGSALDAGEASGGVEAPPTVLLVFHDGSIESVTDYWLDDHWRVHYVTSDGGKHSVPLERLNLVKTSETNMRRGVNLSLDPDSHSDEK